MIGERFKDRQEAAEKLADLLQAYRNSESVVLGIPRGGVVTAKVIAKSLRLSLGIVVVRKIGFPFNSEYAVAAISESGLLVKNEQELSSTNQDWFIDAQEERLQEAKERRLKYWGNKTPLDLRDKTVILVDDGLATGLTMLAAIKEVRTHHPKKIVVAVPVSLADTAENITREADEFVCFNTTNSFAGAVGAYYQDFQQVEDGEVMNILNNPDDPVLFYLPEFGYLAKDILKIPSYVEGVYSINDFPNQEFQILIKSKIGGLPTVFLGSLAPPYRQTMTSLVICHSLKKEGAEKVIAVFPYLSFMRHDKKKPGEDLATALMAKFVKEAGIDELITFDIHSRDGQDFFEVPVKSLSAASLFVQRIKEMGFLPTSIVAPDKGAEQRAREFKNESRDVTNLAVFSKERLANQNIVSVLNENNLGERVIVVDDILDTGETLLSCVKILKEKGVKSIVVAVTHGLFSGDSWRNLFDYGVEKILVTDTVPSVHKMASDKIEVLSVSSLITEELQQIRELR